MGRLRRRQPSFCPPFADPPDEHGSHQGIAHGTINCPEKSLLRDSCLCEYSIFSRETKQAQGRPEHCKWDSPAAAPVECEAPATRISHRQGSGEARRGRAIARTIRASRRDDDPHRIPAWAAGIGAVRATLGSSRSRSRARARTACQERDAERASDGRQRNTRAMNACRCSDGVCLRRRSRLRMSCGVISGSAVEPKSKWHVMWRL